MNEEIRRLLDEEIMSEIEDLAKLPLGSKEKTGAIRDLTALHKIRLEEVKNEMAQTKAENEIEMVREKAKIEIEKEQVKAGLEMENTKDRYLKLWIEAAGIVLPLIFYVYWMRKGFKFEETGTYTSTTFRGLFNRFRPTMK